MICSLGTEKELCYISGETAALPPFRHNERINVKTITHFTSREILQHFSSFSMNFQTYRLLEHNRFNCFSCVGNAP